LLENGFSSRDVVEAVIRKLEDNPLFNAGRGAVVNKSGEVYHDASIMLGSDRNAGAVAGIFVAKNPIQAALAVMENTPHVFLSDKGAEEFILQSGVPLMTQEDSAWYNNFTEQKPVSKKGTVGCVALDRNGDLAAGTSTGGMHNKFPGRIGDSPMVGAGTWADNRTCAVSATGHGEYFIRSAAAHSVSAAMLLGDMDVQSACGHALQEVAALGGKGGLIAIDAQGNFAWDFNTVGMFRAVRTHDYKATLVGLGEEVAVYAH
jgi:isoaspartyl peptidase/L-asparaginase-like protein (Ntn-hydrolase superfamily)